MRQTRGVDLERSKRIAPHDSTKEGVEYCWVEKRDCAMLDLFSDHGDGKGAVLIELTPCRRWGWLPEHVDAKACWTKFT